MSRQSPDVLTNCGNTGPITMIGGGCFQQFDTSSISQSLWINTTRVVDTQTDPGVWTSAGIPPYARTWIPLTMCLGGPATCPPNDDCFIQSSGGPGEGTQCDLPTTCSFLDCTGSDYTLNQSVYHNCYHKTTESVNSSLCKHIGFKNLVARKIWQGRQSYTCRDVDLFNNGLGIFDAFGYCGEISTCAYHGYDASPDPTKYRTITAHCTTTDAQNSPAFTVTSTADGTCTVDRYSGASTSTFTSGSSASGAVPDGLDLNLFANYASQLLMVANSFASICLDAYTSFYNTVSDNGSYPPDIIIQNSPNSWTIQWTFGSGSTVSASAFIDMTSFSYNSGWNAGTTDEQYDSINCSATTLNRHNFFHAACALRPDFGSFTEDITCTLSDPYTSDMVVSDWMDMIMHYWDIGNDALYPFRYRSFENNVNAPLVQRDEVMGVVSIGSSGIVTINGIGVVTTASVSPSTLLYNGSVIGAANVSASTAANWDAKFVNWSAGDGTCGGPISKAQASYGNWSSAFGGVPIASTKWADTFQQKNQIPQGAFLMYQGNELIGGVDVEVYGQWQGYNWARPCGALDRFQLDVTSSNCLNNVSSSVSASVSSSFVFIDPLSFPNHIIGTMTASIWGTGTVDGVWVVSGTSDGTCSLLSLLKSGSDLPFGEVGMWGYASDTTYGAGQICKNRWVNTTPPFCGRVDIVNVIQNTPVTISLMEPQQGIINGDKVWIKDCKGTTELNGGTYTLINMGSPYTDFALLGTVSHSTVYTGNGYVMTPFGVDYKWNSINSRQTYVIGTWDNNTIRSTAEYYRLQAISSGNPTGLVCDGTVGCPSTTTISLPTPATPTYIQNCISSNPCSPSAIGIYPSGSKYSFKNVNVHPFKTNMVLDNRYGNQWQSWIIQSIPDPLYAGTPPCPCRKNLPCDSVDPALGYDCFASEWTWQNDGGNCLGIQNPVCDGIGGLLLNGADYYADANRYEAVINVPVGAPALPSGVDLKQSFVIPSFGNLVYNPWYDTLAKKNCVCNLGRFSGSYSRNGYSCTDQWISLT